MQLYKPTFEIDLSIAFGKMTTAGKYLWINIFLLGDGNVVSRMEMARKIITKTVALMTLILTLSAMTMSVVCSLR